MIWTHLSQSLMEISIRIFQRTRKALRSINLQEVMGKSKHPTRKIQEISLTTITMLHLRMTITMRI
jgi:hypothetical protein